MFVKQKIPHCTINTNTFLFYKNKIMLYTILYMCVGKARNELGKKYI